MMAQQKLDEHMLMVEDKHLHMKVCFFICESTIPHGKKKQKKKHTHKQEKHTQKAQRIDDVKSRSRQIADAKKEIARARLLEKESKQAQTVEIQRQQRAWEVNEKRLKAIDVKEAVERQKRIEAYNLELKQKQLQDKLDKMEYVNILYLTSLSLNLKSLLTNSNRDVEDVKWRAAHDRRQRLEMIRGGPGTPRLSATSPRLASRRSHSAGTSRP